MIKAISPKLKPSEVERLVDRLPQKDKLRLFRKLERETAVQRMEEIFKEIDERRKKYPISDKEIKQEIEKVRRQIYGPRRY